MIALDGLDSAEAAVAVPVVPGHRERGRAGCDHGGVSDASQVTNNQAASRFEVSTGSGLAELVYRRNGKRLVLVHTEVPVELEGRGIAGMLITAALDHAAGEGMTIVPLCPFARAWLERHPEAAARATIDWGDRD